MIMIEYLFEKLEKVQRATRLIISKHLKYEERLPYLKLPILKFRHVTADLIEVYKFFNNMYDSATTGWLLTGKCKWYESSPA